MSVRQGDLTPFVTRWARVGGPDGYTEGTIVKVTRSVLHLQPVLVLRESGPQIVDQLALIALDTIYALRLFDRAETEAQAAQAVEALRKHREADPGVPAPAMDRLGETVRRGHYL